MHARLEFIDLEALKYFDPSNLFETQFFNIQLKFKCSQMIHPVKTPTNYFVVDPTRTLLENLLFQDHYLLRMSLNFLNMNHILFF